MLSGVKLTAQISAVVERQKLAIPRMGVVEKPYHNANQSPGVSA